MRELRANFSAVVRAQTSRILGNRHKARCLIVPIPPSEWHRGLGMDKRMKQTRLAFEELLAHLEH
jgi:hypothetical protein